MKTLFVSICLLLSIGVQAQKLKWETDFTVAKQQALQTNKPILMYFTGSDWCIPCKQLKSDFFATEKFESVANNFVLLRVDFPFREDIISKEQRVKNEELAKIYNPEKSFPTLVGVNGYGSLIKTINGYSPLRETELHYAFLKDVSYTKLH